MHRRSAPPAIAAHARAGAAEPTGHCGVGLRFAQAKWIHRGYLTCQPTLTSCFWSTVSTFNNETLSVWTHVLGFAVTVAFALHHYGLPVVCPWERTVLAGYVASCCVLYTFSAAYHCFKTHQSLRVFNAALAADMSGIVIVFATCTSLLIATVLHDSPPLAALAALAILAPSTAALHLILSTDYTARSLRMKAMVVLFSAGTALLSALFASTGRPDLAQRLVLCVLSFATGAAVYATEFPECLLVRPDDAAPAACPGRPANDLTPPPPFQPGRFDFIGSSHQICTRRAAAAPLLPPRCGSRSAHALPTRLARAGHLSIVVGGWGFYGLCVATVAAYMPSCAHVPDGAPFSAALLL